MGEEVAAAGSVEEEVAGSGERKREDERSATSNLLDIRFHDGTGTLYLPSIAVDDTTEYMLLNLMAFERLHVGSGNDVTAYVFFMDNMVESARDVALLTSRSALDDVHWEVKAYCRKRWNQWRANLVHTYFRIPWSFLSFTATVFLLVLAITQIVYTILQYYSGSN
ncbi:UPF0481 protein At3g47200-like [Miscanthus floridulus]|uniref:UPF0481 protein At3g47200-like n=1 Tax=Miscanthus floridulus TaxID=154761 RepID=UPI00345904E7